MYREFKIGRGTLFFSLLKTSLEMVQMLREKVKKNYIFTGGGGRGVTSDTHLHTLLKKMWIRTFFYCNFFVVEIFFVNS